MIRETCSCGAEFETDDREAIELVKLWRKGHKHSSKADKSAERDSSLLSNTEVSLGFQAIYNPLKEEIE
jgi:hypothetical protein